MELKSNVQLKGDFGNPSGTGVTGFDLYQLPDEARADIQARVKTFADELKTDGFTFCNVGDVNLNYKTPGYITKPGNDANTDALLVVTWRQKSKSAIRHLTIPGAKGNSNFEKKDGGWRLTEAAKTSLATKIDTLYAFTDAADKAVVIQGILVIKR